MRFAIAAASVLILAGSVWAQSLPGGLTPEQMKAIPPEVLKSLPPDVLSKIPLKTLMALPPDLFKNITPDMLAKIPPNAAAMTPEDAKAYYKGLDPAQKQALKEQAKQIKSQIEGVPGLMDQLKALYKSFRGS
ncbi:MAG: hypothetical protein EXR07_18435 [Acetobacteraceae bacterium]|nr:hypothetical protein [Acetobacteraceae bacterium]